MLLSLSQDAQPGRTARTSAFKAVLMNTIPNVVVLSYNMAEVFRDQKMFSGWMLSCRLISALTGFDVAHAYDHFSLPIRTADVEQYCLFTLTLFRTYEN